MAIGKERQMVYFCYFNIMLFHVYKPNVSYTTFEYTHVFDVLNDNASLQLTLPVAKKTEMGQSMLFINQQKMYNYH